MCEKSKYFWSHNGNWGKLSSGWGLFEPLGSPFGEAFGKGFEKKNRLFKKFSILKPFISGGTTNALETVDTSR